ncbi:MAG TPA: hypothetical protein VER98_09515 [Terriglobia bacterium]|nr:hypothetical protein [Terriglobia bacterium]
MRNDPSGNDPRTIWQDQPTEPSAMTLEKIRRKVRELHAKTRRELLGNIAAPLAVVVFSGLGAAIFDDPPQRTAFALALAWALAGQYFLHRGMWSATLPGDAALTTGLEFYRREIERRRYLFRRVLKWSFGPMLLAIGALLLPIVTGGVRERGAFRNMIPFLTLLALWLVGFFVIRMRQHRELQREIEELNDIERENKR